MRMPSRTLALLCALFGASGAQATFHTFTIEQLYSNADGSVQYVVLHESQNEDGEYLLGGHALTVTGHGFSRSFTFPADLPSASTAGKRVLLATRAFPANATAKLYGYPPPPPPPDPPVRASAAPDYILPDRFLPTDGGTLDYAGVDQVSFGPLPTDGATAMARDGTPRAAVAVNFAGVATALHPTSVTAVEFHDDALDHYFISASAPDIDALDSGRIAGWKRTGGSFPVLPAPGLSTDAVNPVCRFYIPPQHGDSHFFSASPDECATVLARASSDPNYSGFIEETDHAFYIALPDVLTGACPADTVPVYRLFDNRADANHRYTTDPAIKAAMIARGYVAEGYGPNAVIMCAPAGG